MKVKETEALMKCPSCKESMALLENMFHWRGRYFSGWVCKKCNALYENENDSMFKYAGAK